MVDAKVCMVVWNDFVHDARVMKECESLLSQGAAVSVIAIKSPQRSRDIEVLSNKLRVLRVDGGRKGAGEAVEKGAVDHSPIKVIGGVWHVFSTLIRRLPGMFRVVWAAKNEKPDLYFAHDVNVLPLVWFVSLLARRPFVYDAHEISSHREGYRFASKLVYLIERLLAPRAALMITTSDARSDFFAATYSVRKPLVLQNRPRYAPIGRTNYLREHFQIPQERKIVLYQGGLQPGRGLRNILLAADRLRQHAFVFVGGGKQLPLLKQRASELSLDGVVFFHEPVPVERLPEITASADVGLQVIRNTCLNHYTTDSNKLFEYIMSGLPVVASNFPEIGKVVVSNGVGVVVEPDDVSQIVAAIEHVMDDANLARLRDACLSTRKTLCWEVQEPVFVSEVKRVLAESRSRW